ncbi:MAG: hypothetical protein AAFX94_23605 [Myxococcota bacterium]
MLLALYVASPQSTTHSETIELIGFSKHEDAAAFRVRVERPAPLDAGDVDRFTVIRVVNTKTGEVIGHFRQGRIRRTDANGRRARMASAELLSADNPMWLDALPAAKWKRVRRHRSSPPWTCRRPRTSSCRGQRAPVEWLRL